MCVVAIVHYGSSSPTPVFQAFSHFTFEHSGHKMIVVDIQGVGDLWTDPQIHTYDGKAYGDGNLGVRGFALFFHTHRCNPLCTALGLAQFDLYANEQELSSLITFAPQSPISDVAGQSTESSPRVGVEYLTWVVRHGSVVGGGCIFRRYFAAH